MLRFANLHSCLSKPILQNDSGATSRLRQWLELFALHGANKKTLWECCDVTERAKFLQLFTNLVGLHPRISDKNSVNSSCSTVSGINNSRFED